MKHFPARSALAAAVLGAFLVAPAGAETLIGLTTTNQLVTFDSASPGMAGPLMTITGLAPDERILGIDHRPTTGLLYGIGSASNLYTLDAATGSATLVAALVADPSDTTQPFAGLAGASRRLVGLALDPASLPRVMGGGLRLDSAAVATARSLVAFAAAAAGVPGLVFAPAVAAGEVEAFCAAMRAEGFTGVIADDADQLSRIAAIFLRDLS